MIFTCVVFITFLICAYQSFFYMEHLFSQMKMPWTRSNQALWALICLAGPAAFLCVLIVDATRPLERLV